jgi:hypothetical protein
MSTYQLVIQFSLDERDVNRLDSLLRFEEDLESWLASEAEVDGNDFGQAEMNIFIHTEDPVRTFKHVQILLEGQHQYERYRAGYRMAGTDAYTPLWPPNLRDFRVA